MPASSSRFVLKVGVNSLVFRDFENKDVLMATPSSDVRYNCHKHPLQNGKNVRDGRVQFFRSVEKESEKRRKMGKDKSYQGKRQCTTPSIKEDSARATRTRYNDAAA